MWKKSRKLRSSALAILLATSMVAGMAPGSIGLVQASEPNAKTEEEAGFLDKAKGFFSDIGDGITNFFAGEDSVEPYAVGDSVTTMTPTGVTVDLFNYQQFNNEPLRSEYIGTGDAPYSNGTQGINANHDLKFGNGGVGNFGNNNRNINTYSGSQGMGDTGIYEGIVQDELVDGYPVLTAGLRTGMLQPDDRTRAQSLDYLFNPEMEVDGRTDYPNVQDLLEVDSDNYYSFNSRNRFATLVDGKRFEVRESSTQPNNGRGVGFFPFNTLNRNGNGLADDTDFHVGVAMTTRFLQTDGGTRPDGSEVTYSFSGDDDVWIFIDGKLVADLGGIHGATSVNMNFATGAIEISNRNGQMIEQDQTIGEILGYGRDSTLPDDTLHTLKFFYLERGAGQSNMNLRFNLVTVPESRVEKTDEVGTSLAGAVFALYEANNNYEINGDSVATGRTNSEGLITLEDAEGRPIYFTDLFNRTGSTHYVLREVSAPAGYRLAPDMHLEYDRITGAVVSANHWETGTYASGKERAVIDNKDGEPTPDPYAFTNALRINGRNYNTAAELLEDGALPEGRGQFFALPLRYVGDGTDFTNQDEWYGVYKVGDQYRLSEKSSSNLVGVAQATQNGGATAFKPNANGQYEVNVEDLPGLLREYYFVLNENNENIAETKWTLAFYYTTANSWTEVETNNTVRLANSDNFTRQFAANLKVADMTNELYVEKKDELGNPVNGAEFSLYDTGEFDENITADELRTEPAYDIVTTEELALEGDTISGAAKFPSAGNILEAGNYYLVETAAPEGYALNDSVIQVRVADDGVYANATAIGTEANEEDGVVVREGVGHLVHSMEQFAYGVTDGSGRAIDTTLHDIQIAPQIKGNWDEEWPAASKNEDDWIHLRYGNPGRAMDYGPAEEGGKISAETESGWIHLAIQQCMEHKADTPSDYEDLGDRDLNSLFAGYTVVEVTDKRVADLDLSKVIAGYEHMPQADLEALQRTGFTFEVQLFEEDGTTPLAGTYQIVDRDAENAKPIGTVRDGVAEITLSHNQHAVIRDIPEGARYSITETKIAGESQYQLDLFETTIVTNDNFTPETVEELEATEEKEEKGFLERAGEFFSEAADKVKEFFGAEPKNSIEAYAQIDNSARTITGSILDVNTEDESGALFETITVEYTNEYKLTPAELVNGIQGVKVLAGRDWTEDDAFNFVIESVDTGDNDITGPMPAEDKREVTVTSESAKTGEKVPFAFDFKDVKFTEPGKYVYRIYEKQPLDGEFLPGLSYSQALYEVTVDVTNQDADGNYTDTLTATVSTEQIYNDVNGEGAGEVDEIVFTNTYNEGAANFTLSATKTLTRNGESVTPRDRFTFRLTGSDGAPMPAGANNNIYETKNDGSSIAFGSIQFTEKHVGTHTYTMQELLNGEPVTTQNNVLNGMTYDASSYTVTVSVGKNDNNVLTITTSVTDEGGNSLEGQAITFANSYESQPATAAVQGIKTIKEASWNPDGHFNFVMSPANETTRTAVTPDESGEAAITFASRPENPMAVEVPDNIGEDGSRTFNFGHMTFNKAGTYVFNVTEVIPTELAPGMTYDRHISVVTITVSEQRDVAGNMTGQLQAKVTYNNNTAGADDDVTGITDTAAFVNTYSETGTATLTGTKQITGRDFQATDSFTFHVDATDDAPLPSRVDTDGNITIRPRNGASSNINFGTIPFTAAGQSYEYTIQEVAPQDAQNNVKDGVTYDATPRTVTVTAASSGNYDGTLAVTYKVDGADVTDLSTLIWRNAYDATGTTSLGGSKVLEGREWKADETYSFTLEAGNEYTRTAVDNGAIVLPVPEQLTTSVIGANGNFTFDDITFTRAMEGNQPYVFIIRENLPDDDDANKEGVQKEGVTYDSHKYRINVIVTDNGDGTLNVLQQATNSSVFTNRYAATGMLTAPVTVLKTVEGRDWQAQEIFDFTMTPVSYQETKGAEADTTTETLMGMPRPADGTMLSIAKAEGANVNTAMFSEMTFTKAGIYTYKITENAGTGSLTYSQAEYELVVTVTDKNDGTLTIANVLNQVKDDEGTEVTGITVTEAAFTNSYEREQEEKDVALGNAPDTSVNGDNVQVGDELFYTIEWINDAVNDKGEATTATVTITDTVPAGTALVEGSISNGGVHENGTITWNLGEQEAEATGEVSFKVKVTEDAVDQDPIRNVANVQIGDNAPRQTTETENTVPDSGEASVTFTKALTGRNWLPTDKFTFTLTPVSYNGDTSAAETMPMPKNDADEDITSVDVIKPADAEVAENEKVPFTFGTFNFKQAGTYVYEVTENDIDQAVMPGVKKDSDKATITIEVVVSADGTELKATANADKEDFINAYDPSSIILQGDTALKAQKTFTGREWKDADTFTFNVVKKSFDGSEAEADLEKMPEVPSLEIGKPATGTVNTASFGGLDGVTFDAVGTYVYEVTEQKGGSTEKGITYDNHTSTMTVVVTDHLNGVYDGQLHATVTYDNASASTDADKAVTNAVAFTNTYTAGGIEVDTDPAEASAYFNKVLAGRDWLENDEFTFTIEPKDGAPAPEKATVSVKSDKAKAGDSVPFGFGKIVFSAADLQGQTEKIFTYEVKEVVPEDGAKIPGITYDGHTATLTITVTDNQEGQLNATASVQTENGTFTNRYSSELDYTALGGLQITKVLNGRDMEAEQFTFTVTPENKDAADKLGLKEGENEFKNTAKAAGVEDTIDVLAGKNVTFTQADAGKTFTYTVAEEVKGDNTTYTYDDAPRTVTIEVMDNKDATLTVKTTVKKGEEVVDTQSVTTGDEGQKKATVAFVNTYNDVPVILGGEGEVSINATKSLTNRPMVDGEFTFNVLDNQDKEVTTGTNDAEGTITFNPVEYTTDKLMADVKAGIATVDKENAPTYVYTYDYTVAEDTTKLDGGVTPITKNPFKIQVVVTDDGNGTLTINVVYPEGKDSLAFENAYGTSANAEVYVNGQKELKVESGDNVPNIKGKYTFKIEGSEGAPMPVDEDGNPVTSTVNDEAGNINFGKIFFTMENVFGNDAAAEEPETPGTEEGTEAKEAEADVAGAVPAEAEAEIMPVKSPERTKTFTYTVTESGNVPGVTNDPDAENGKTFTATVTDKGDGTISVEGPEQFAFEFTNTYRVDPVEYNISTDLSIKKELSGREMKEGEFTFELINEKDKSIRQAVNDAKGNVKFESITYTAPGVYNYVIREQQGTANGVQYDSAEYAVTVVVTDNGDGTLSAKAETENKDGIVFKNIYETTPASVTLGASKVYEGAELKDKQFTFQLKDKDGKVVSEAKNTKEGQVAFETITYDEAGTYEYTISEKNDNQKDVTYDETVYTVTVTVTDNGEGSLLAKVAYKDGKAPVFKNSYTEPEKPGEPTKPEEPKGPTAVKTGDEAPVLPFIILMVATLVIIVTISFVFFRRRRR